MWHYHGYCGIICLFCTWHSVYLTMSSACARAFVYICWACPINIWTHIKCILPKIGKKLSCVYVSRFTRVSAYMPEPISIFPLFSLYVYMCFLVSSVFFVLFSFLHCYCRWSCLCANHKVSLSIYLRVTGFLNRSLQRVHINKSAKERTQWRQAVTQHRH